MMINVQLMLVELISFYLIFAQFCKIWGMTKCMHCTIPHLVKHSTALTEITEHYETCFCLLLSFSTDLVIDENRIIKLFYLSVRTLTTSQFRPFFFLANLDLFLWLIRSFLDFFLWLIRTFLDLFLWLIRTFFDLFHWLLRTLQIQ